MNVPSTALDKASTSSPSAVRNVRASSIDYRPSRFDADVFESGPGELRDVLVIAQRAGHAADPQLHALPDCGRHLAANDDIGDGEPSPGFSTRNASRSTRSLSPERLITQFEMITSTELSGSGMCSISPFRNSTLLESALALVLLGDREHLVGHVEAVGLAGRPDPPRGQQHVDAAAGARSSTVSPGFNSARAVGLPQPSDASQRQLRHLARLVRVVQIRCDRVAARRRRRRSRSTRSPRRPWHDERPGRTFSRTTSLTFSVSMITRSFRYLHCAMTRFGSTALFRVQHSA